MNHSKANDYARIRSDHRAEITEDYVEAIADLVAEKGQCRGADLARHFSVSHATVTQTLSRLKEAGLATFEPYGPIGLTRKGKQIAKESRERHDTVVAFLIALGISPGVAAADAEGIEHHVSKETLDRFREFVEKQAGKTERR